MRARGASVSGMKNSEPVSRTAQRMAELAERRSNRDDRELAARVKRSKAGRGLARDRLKALLDPDTFLELDPFVRTRATAAGMDKKAVDGDGVIVGTGRIDGREVAIFAQDFSVMGGSLGEAHGRKITKVQDLALAAGIPIIGLFDGGGARIQEGVSALTQFAEIFKRNVAASGVIPQISVILGPAAGGAVYSPALTDAIIMAEGTSQMFITGPDVIRAVTGEDVTFDELGGARAHSERSGVAHFWAQDEEDAFAYLRELLDFLPQNNLAEPLERPAETEKDPADDAALDSLIPASDAQPYDMAEVISTVVDDGHMLEMSASFAPNIITAFARIGGRSVGVVANQPTRMAGTLDIDAAEKAARFVRTCDAFNLPIITFVDVPGFLPGTDQEWDGIIRRGAKLIYAYAEASVPLITTVTRKAYGGAYIVMGSRMLGADLALAWPSAQIAVMGAGGAVNILSRRELAAAAEAGRDVEEVRAELIAAYEDEIVGPWEAAERGYVDAVISPSETRWHIMRALQTLHTKRATPPERKHGNIPL